MQPNSKVGFCAADFDELLAIEYLTSAPHAQSTERISISQCCLWFQDVDMFVTITQHYSSVLSAQPGTFDCLDCGDDVKY